jgi:hypothetical protein
MTQPDVPKIISSLVDVIEKMHQTMSDIRSGYESDYYGDMGPEHAIYEAERWIDSSVVKDVLRQAKIAKARLVKGI